MGRAVLGNARSEVRGGRARPTTVVESILRSKTTPFIVADFISKKGLKSGIS